MSEDDFNRYLEDKLSAVVIDAALEGGKHHLDPSFVSAAIKEVLVSMLAGSSLHLDSYA